MPVVYEKTYRPIYLNVDAQILGQLDEYRSSSMPRTKHIHAALEMYIHHLHKTNAKKNVWCVSEGTR